jgi:hypothetical protein
MEALLRHGDEGQIRTGRLAASASAAALLSNTPGERGGEAIEGVQELVACDEALRCEQLCQSLDSR